MVMDCIYFPMLLVAIVKLVNTHASSYHIALLGTDLLNEIVLNFVEEIAQNVTVSTGMQCINTSIVRSAKSIALSYTECSGLLLPNSTELMPKGIKVNFSESFTMYVLQSESTQTEGYLAIADDCLGNEYYVLTYCSTGGTCQFAVTAVADETSLVITFPSVFSNASANVNGQTISTTGTILSVLINEYDVLHMESAQDLSGTHILANKNVSVFVGARGVPSRFPFSLSHMIEQIPPVNKWGSQFIVTPSYLNDVGDIVKIVTQTENTKMSMTGLSPFIIQQKGDSVERRIEWNIVSKIKSSSPVLVMLVLSIDLYGTNSTTDSFPAMVLVSSSSHWSSQSGKFFCNVDTGESACIVITMNFNELYNISSIPINKTLDGIGFKAIIQCPMIGVQDWVDFNPGTRVGAYGYCKGQAYLLNANWTTDTEVCRKTISAPGDEIDNDCDGDIDEETCTSTDFPVHFVARQSDNGESTYKKIFFIRGFNPVFRLQTCGIAVVKLQANYTSVNVLTIQISPWHISISYCTPACIQPIIHPVNSTVICTTAKSYTINLKGNQNVNVRNGTVTQNGDEVVIQPDVFFEYDEMITTVFVGNATFDIAFPEMDCGKIIDGEANTFGRDFLVPVRQYDDFEIYVTSLKSSIVTLCYSNTKLEIALSNLSTIPIVNSNFSGNYSGVTIHTNNPVSVILLLNIASRPTLLRILPQDILEPSYHLLLDKNDTIGYCDVFALEVELKLLNSSITLSKWKTMNITNDMYDGTEALLGNKPYAVFCHTSEQASLQMPPRKTLGQLFYIPKLTSNVMGTTTRVKIVTTEDGTVLIIRGEYDEVKIFRMTGEIYDRSIVNDTLYTIYATKPVQVHLLIEDSKWAAALNLPPVKQYSTHDVAPSMAETNVVLSSSVDSEGNTTMSTSSQPRNYQNITQTLPFFTITVLKKTQDDRVLLYLTSDVNYHEINKVCSMTSGYIADGKDNDCDKMVDEEYCPAKVVMLNKSALDYDIDGRIYDDCNSTVTPTMSEVNLIFTDMTCTPKQCATVNNETTSPVVDIYQPAPIPSAIAPVYPTATSAHGALDQTNESTSNNVTSGNDTAVAGGCVTDCLVPCGWVKPANFTEAEIQQKVKDIQAKLLISKEKLSSTVRTKTSADDSRPSVRAVGSIGIVFLVVTIGSIFVLDTRSIAMDLRRLLENLRHVFQR